MLALGSACSPTLDWRDVRPAGTQLALQFPCRPVTQERELPLAGRPVKLALMACTAGGQTWALAHADVIEPALVGAALAELRAGAAAKLGTTEGAPLPLTVAGATPQANAARLRLAGRAGDRAATLQMELAVFAHGTRVFQASVLGERPSAEAADTFVAALRFVPG